MMIASPLFINVQVSKLKLYFLITAHVLATLSILLISDLSLTGVVLKIILVLVVALSFRRCLNHHQNNIHFSLQTENLLDLNIGHQDYRDLQLSGDSYVSNLLVQLIGLDDETGASYNVTIFPDAIDAAMHSQLRARLNTVTNHGHDGLA